MAIDTATRRASVIGVELEFIRVYPLPDNSIGAEDRAHIAWAYPGISAVVGTGGPGSGGRGKAYGKAGSVRREKR